ncbi:hypothetical protein Golax_011178, partial [Gossypium laxum]|nr:hypothetical protein [Gossypium laxum]
MTKCSGRSKSFRQTVTFELPEGEMLENLVA